MTKMSAVYRAIGFTTTLGAVVWFGIANLENPQPAEEHDHPQLPLLALELSSLERHSVVIDQHLDISTVHAGIADAIVANNKFLVENNKLLKLNRAMNMKIMKQQGMLASILKKQSVGLSAEHKRIFTTMLKESKYNVARPEPTSTEANSFIF